jgi:hypothetical protein
MLADDFGLLLGLATEQVLIATAVHLKGYFGLAASRCCSMPATELMVFSAIKAMIGFSRTDDRPVVADSLRNRANRESPKLPFEIKSGNF